LSGAETGTATVARKLLVALNTSYPFGFSPSAIVLMRKEDPKQRII
jgi:hypothetical protein